MNYNYILAATFILLILGIIAGIAYMIRQDRKAMADHQEYMNAMHSGEMRKSDTDDIKGVE